MICLSEYSDFARWVFKTTGYSWRSTVKVLKDLNSRARKAAAGYPVSEPVTVNGVWCRTSRVDGLPTKLGELGRLLAKHPQIALIIFNVIQVVKLSPEFNTDTVTGAYTGSSEIAWLESFKAFIKVNAPKLNLSKKIKPRMSTKAGPMGPIATLMAGVDTLAVAMSPSALTVFMKAVRALGLLKLEEQFESFIGHYLRTNDSKQLVNIRQLCLARLTFLSDKAGKTRIVYILNWWMQQLLLPYHDALMNWFKHQPQDATWDQSATASVVQKWTKEGRRLFSFDLTAATDRWPLWHQKLVMQQVFGQKEADVWSEIMKIAPYVDKTETWVSYAVGQPMGAYASWAALNVTHHMVLRYLCWVHSVNPIDAYVVLGDDMVVSHKGVASAYQALLQDLGVGISLPKSIINRPGGPSSAEFAKHIFREGVNLTPLSPILLKEIYEDYDVLKVLDLLKDLGTQYGIRPVRDGNGNILVPPLVVKLLSPLMKRDGALITLLVTSPIHPQQIVDEVDKLNCHPESPRYKVWKDPWFGYPQHLILTAHGHAEYEKLTNLAASVTALQQELQLSADKPLGPSPGTFGSGLLLENPFHPFYWVMEALLESIRDILRSVDQGQSVGTGSLITDADLILDAYKGKELHSWKRRRIRHMRTRRNMVKRIHQLCIDPSPMYY